VHFLKILCNDLLYLNSFTGLFLNAVRLSCVHFLHTIRGTKPLLISLLLRGDHLLKNLRLPDHFLPDHFLPDHFLPDHFLKAQGLRIISFLIIYDRGYVLLFFYNVNFDVKHLHTDLAYKNARFLISHCVDIFFL